MMAQPGQDIQPKRSQMKAPDCVCHTGALLQVYARPCCPARVFMCQPLQVSWMADRRISQTSTATPAEPGELPCYQRVILLATNRFILVESGSVPELGEASVMTAPGPEPN